MRLLHSPDKSIWAEASLGTQRHKHTTAQTSPALCLFIGTACYHHPTRRRNMMKRLPVMLALAALMLVGNTHVRAQEANRKFVPVTDAMLQKPDPSNWMMWRR